MNCIHCTQCGVGYTYYNGPEHAGRRSCRTSISGYHDFKSYYWDWICDFLNCRSRQPVRAS